MAMHGIKVVVNRTGLTAHVLRVWEKRYGAVTPERTDTNRRLYSDEHIDRLLKLVTLTRAGHSIGQIASLSDREIEDLVNAEGKVTHMNPPTVDQQVPAYIDECLKAIRKFDQARLEVIFDGAIRDLGYAGLIIQVMLPLIQRVGTEWHDGNITTADEHAATSFIKSYLSQRVDSYASTANAPVLLVTTPAGQLHELGAFISSCMARKMGWQVVYLGPSLPADAIAGAAIRANAKAVLLSIIYPLDDPALPGELRRLRQQLPENISILVGGDAIYTYDEALTEISATVIDTIPELEDHLDAIRHPQSQKKQAD